MYLYSGKDPAKIATYRRICFYLCKQFKQNVCSIQFIESFYLNMGSYKTREVK